MKFSIFVFALVLLAYHEASGQSPFMFPALIEGNCKPEQLPPDVKGACNKVQCSKEGFREPLYVVTHCPTEKCPNGKKLGTGPHDLSKTFPHCCLPNKCD